MSELTSRAWAGNLMSRLGDRDPIEASDLLGSIAG